MVHAPSTARASLAVLRQMPAGLDRLFDGGGTGWRRRSKVRAVPADRLLPPLAEAGGSGVDRLARPVAFRAPLLPSQLHPQWDSRFFASTTRQLELVFGGGGGSGESGGKGGGGGGGWADVWLPPAERQSVAEAAAAAVRATNYSLAAAGVSVEEQPAVPAQQCRESPPAAQECVPARGCIDCIQ